MEKVASLSIKKPKLLKTYSILAIPSAHVSKRLSMPPVRESKTEREFSKKSRKSLMKKFKISKDRDKK
jgi:hypothetical protein